MLDSARMLAVRGWRRLSRAARQRLRDRRLRAFFSARRISDPILLCGFPKSGNTWIRFVLFNYHNVLLKDAQGTLTYDELNRIQRHALEWPLVGEFENGFPVFFRTHLPHRPIFEMFRVIYVYRHPLDALVSYYHSHTDRVRPFPRYSVSLRRKLEDIDYFVLRVLPRWIRHYRSTAPRSDALARYEAMKAAPVEEFTRIFSAVGIDPDSAALERAVRISSKEEIQRMGRRTGQRAGGSETLFATGYEFIRSGASGQYRSRLRPETLERARRVLRRSGVEQIEV